MSTILIDNASHKFAELAGKAKNKRQIHAVMAAGALPVAQRHFQGKATTEKNPYGVRSSFWNRMLSGTKALATNEFGIVRMPPEVGGRYFGGTRTPKKAKYLTIPARAEAYGKSARDFNNLRFAVLPVGGPALVEAEATKIKRRKSKGTTVVKQGEETGGAVFYWLKRKVTVSADRTVLPTEAEIKAGVDRALNTYFFPKRT